MMIPQVRGHFLFARHSLMRRRVCTCHPPNPAKDITHPNKTSIMKTFVRKSGVFAIALLIAMFFINATSYAANITSTGTGGVWNATGTWLEVLSRVLLIM